MEGSVSVADDLGAPPESWEVADLDASMRRLILSSKKDQSDSSSSSVNNNQSELPDSSALAGAGSAAVSGSVSEDVVNTVDQFLREALQNPRERLSVLRMEQDVEKFIRDPGRQQMEFQQLPTSYLRLAAHRVAQHYSLQSMVLLDNSLPDGSGSRIIVRKTSECRMPLIRLADIPVNLPQGDTGVVKVAIKQRPQKGSQLASGLNSNSSKGNSAKSVEERKEEYNRARARIFNSNSLSGSSNVKPETESRSQDTYQYGPIGIPQLEEKASPAGGSDLNTGRGLIDSSTSSSRSARSRTEKEPVGRSKSYNKVAIFRDREIDRKDPDYDRNYDRYMQRFDPGFGFAGGPYTIQPMYAPAINYNTEFPQLGSALRSPISAENQPRPLPQHLPGPWATSTTPGIGYGPAESMMPPPFSHNHVSARSNSAIYLHSTQYPCQRPGMTFIHPHEQVHQPFSQPHQSSKQKGNSDRDFE
ncbi:R3H domain-containing protein 2-like isoform X1 [Solanum tuberosum]|uniref:R3H domain-containing protein 2-like isoform X1 n=1 Tax=Solanum tuberosum TaxID=4113 RepID=UPI0003D299C6|nr:PREDICTED: R3H domain-containing protein 2-like isoform X1 [Solanum tuberosum]